MLWGKSKFFKNNFNGLKKKKYVFYYAPTNTNLLLIILQVKLNHAWPRSGLFGLGMAWGCRVAFLVSPKW